MGIVYMDIVLPVQTVLTAIVTLVVALFEALRDDMTPPMMKAMGQSI